MKPSSPAGRGGFHADEAANGVIKTFFKSFLFGL